MSSIYTPSPTVHGSYVLPSDGDPAVAESVNDALRDLADGVLNANTNASTALALASQMINGVTGGSYSPAAEIELTGGQRLHLNEFGIFIEGTSGLVVDGSFSVSTSGWSFSSPGSVTGAVTFTGTADFSELTVIDASIRNLSISGDTNIGNSISDELIVEATTTFESPVTFESTETHNGIVDFNNNVNFNDDVQLGDGSGDAIQVLGQLFLHSRLRYEELGRVPYKEPVTLPNSSATVSLADGEIFAIDYSYGALRTYTLSSSGASPGDKMLFSTFVNNVTAAQISIQGVQGIIFPAGASNVCAEFVFVEATSFYSAGWRPLRKNYS